MKLLFLRCFFAVSVGGTLLCCGCTGKARALRHVKRGDDHYAKGQWESAKLEYLTAVRRGLRDPRVMSRLGECFLKNGEIGSAYQCLSDARTAQPTNIVARQTVGALLLAFGQAQKAREEAEAILNLSPGDPQGLVLLAESSASPEQIAGATARIDKAAHLSRTNEGVPFAYAELALKTRDYESVRSNYARAIELAPKRAEFHLALAKFAANQRDTNTADASFKSAVALAAVRSVERLSYAEFLQKQKRTEEAEKFLEQTIAQAPDFLRAINQLTELLIQESKFTDAEKYNLKALALAPADRDALIFRARLKLARKDTAGALADLQDLSKSRAKDAVVHHQLAVAYLANGDTAKARTALDTAVTLDPKLMPAVLLRSELQLQNHEFTAAIPELARLTREFPDAPEAYFLLASAYRQRGTFNDAIPIYNALAAASPGNPQPYQLLGLTYREMKNPAEARKAFEKALELLPEFVAPVEQLTELDIEEGKFDSALARLQPYVANHPDRSVVFFLQAKVFAAAKRNDEALRALQKALEIDPESVLLQRALVDVLKNSGKTQQAVAQLNAMVKKNPQDIESLAALAMVAEGMNDFKAARANYETILKIKPDAAGVLNNLANLLADRFNETGQALEYARRARELVPNEPRIADTYGWALWRKGDFAAALPLLQQANAGLPDNAEVQFHLAMAYYMMGAEEPALAGLQAAARSQEEFTGKDSIENALAVLKVSPSAASDKDVEFLHETLKKSPSDLMAQLRLAQIAENRKKWDQAVKEYETALRLFPRSTNALTRLAEINASRIGNLPRGLEYAKQAWIISQDELTADVLGRIGFMSGDFKWAIAPLSTAHRAQPEDAGSTFYLALTTYALGKPDQAKDLFADLQGKGPQAALAQRAVTLIEYQRGTGEASPAAAAAAAALQTDQNFAPALIVTGLLAEEKKDYPAARAQYEKLLKAAPAHVLGQRQLGLLLAERMSEDQKATPLLNTSKAELPGDAVIAKALGKIAFRRGDYREAVGFLKDARLSLSNDSDVLYHLGLTQYHLNDGQARELLNQALKADSNSVMAASARTALQAMK